jgi:hypothetical protein
MTYNMKKEAKAMALPEGTSVDSERNYRQTYY